MYAPSITKLTQVHAYAHPSDCPTKLELYVLKTELGTPEWRS